MIAPCSGWTHRTVETDDTHWAPMSTCWRRNGDKVEFHVHRDDGTISYRKYEDKA